MKTLELFGQNSDEQLGSRELTRVPEILKERSEACYRSAFFSEEGKANCFGPMTMIFAVRLAKDLLLEGCDYSGVDIKLETAGRVLPAIPAQNELVKLLDAPDTMIHVNGKVYKPNSEVYGFQHVYDDAAKCMDKLKQMGFTNDTMAIFATPDDITLEINGSAFGLEGNNELASRYYKLICYIAEVKDVGGTPQKSSIKTILLDTTMYSKKILIPGSIHPVLKRNKVGIGASHFSFGIAAFDEMCSKKHTARECIQEALNWVKFNEKQLTPVAGIRELLDSLNSVALPDQSKTASIASSVNSANVLATLAPVTAKNFIGVFQPLKIEIEATAPNFKGIAEGIHSFSGNLDKTLGRGWSHGGLHLILGERENGKASMLMQQSLLIENKMPVLYVSYEQTVKDFVINASCLTSGINKSELWSGLSGNGPNYQQVRLAFGSAVDKLQIKLSHNLFFSGVEAGRTSFDADEIIQLASMLPDAPNKLVIIESINEEDFDDIKAQLQKLKAIALAGNVTVIMSVHTKGEVSKRPNLVEDSDLELLTKYQRFSDTIIDLNTSKVNMRKFVALIKGQIDPALVSNLEQKALQLCGGKRLKSDTYSLARVIHNRNGRRDMILYLYQPDMGRFFDLATVGMGKA